MNQKEYELIAEVIRQRKENASQLYKLGYSEDQIMLVLNTIEDLQQFLTSKMSITYRNFDIGKFTAACEL